MSRWGVQLNPIAMESQNSKITPVAGVAGKLMDQYLLHKLNDGSAATSQWSKEGLKLWRAKDEYESTKKHVDEDFKHRFISFLTGRMEPVVRADGRPFGATPGWGNRYTSLMNNPEVRDWIFAQQDERRLFDRWIYVQEKLGTAIGYDPKTGDIWTPGIEDWYLYYKYILEGSKIVENSEDFLSDFTMYVTYLEAKRAKNKFNNPATAPHSMLINDPRYKTRLHQWRPDILGDPSDYKQWNMHPMGDANAGVFGPHHQLDRRGAWLTAGGTALANKALTRDDWKANPTQTGGVGGSAQGSPLDAQGVEDAFISGLQKVIAANPQIFTQRMPGPSGGSGPWGPNPQPNPQITAITASEIQQEEIDKEREKDQQLRDAHAAKMEQQRNQQLAAERQKLAQDFLDDKKALLKSFQAEKARLLHDEAMALKQQKDAYELTLKVQQDYQLQLLQASQDEKAELEKEFKKVLDQRFKDWQEKREEEWALAEEKQKLQAELNRVAELAQKYKDDLEDLKKATAATKDVTD